MIWLASYPRSGNTFFRNLIYEAFGMESSEFHFEAFAMDENYESYPFVKTHLLPHQVHPLNENTKVVYLVRDGRDAVVSMAHHKKDLVETESEFQNNLEEIILAAEGSHFGGWSENVMSWLKHADLVIRFEDLVTNPMKIVEQIAELSGQKPKDNFILPDFESQKSGLNQYGKISKRDENLPDFSDKFFRKGKIGAYMDEMHEHLHDLFWNYHGDAMKLLGYEYEGSFSSKNYSVLPQLNEKLGLAGNRKEVKTTKVLIDATKIAGKEMDGVKRYSTELIRTFIVLEPLFGNAFSIKLSFNGAYHKLQNFNDFLNTEILYDFKTMGYEKHLLQFKNMLKKMLPEAVYEFFAKIYRSLNFRKILKLLKETLVKRKSQSNPPISGLSENRENFDILHLLAPQNLSVTEHNTSKIICTVHDVSHRELGDFHEDQNIENSEQALKELSAYSNAYFITPSRFSAKRFDEIYQAVHQPSVIPESAARNRFKWFTNQNYTDFILQEHKLTRQNYFFCLGTIEPRKNLLNTIDAFLALKNELNSEVKLVISGNKGWKNQAILSKIHHQKDVIFTGFMPEKDLPVLFSNAIALLYTSHYEGFGLPILESMSCRCPVIFGNNTSQPEVAGDGGIPVNSNSVDEIKNAMKKMLLEPDFREDLAKKAWKQSFKFSWIENAIQTLNYYKQIEIE